MILSAGLLAACGGTSWTSDDEPAGVDAAVDAAPTWTFPDVFGVPDVDDDDRNGRADWADPPDARSDDLATLVLPAATLGLVPAGGDVQLTLSGAVADVRVLREGTVILGGSAGPTYTFSPAGADVELAVELRTYLSSATLEVAARAPGGAVDRSTSVTLQASPLVMNHHLQPAERVWAVQVSGNASLLASFEAALGTARFTRVPGASYGSDVWIQDEIEFATLTGSPAQRIDVVIDSIRNRGLDDFPEDNLVAPGVIAATWGSGQATTYDSFGNLEASPPVTVGGTSYPFGRIYYGFNTSVGLSSGLRTFLRSQKLQAPFELPTSWLCVGHVDEFVTFVPDPTSAKGFKLAIADVRAAWALIDALPATASLGRYGNDHGYATVGALRGDADLRAYNDDLQADYLDPIRATMKAELGLADDDVIAIPSLFESIGTCGGRAAALIPGMVNLAIAQVDGVTHLFTADPFFRASGAAQTADPVVARFAELMPPGMQLHFVDDWNVYHLGLGEVHCGSNVQRTPTATWWTTATHLTGSK